MKNIFIIALILLTSCCSERDSANCHNAVIIINNSNKTIYFNSSSDRPEIGYGYNPLKSGDYFKIPIGSSKKDPYGRERGCYEDLFLENNNKLYYLVFDEQVLLSEPWDSIVKYDKVLKRYSFTLQEMQAANFTIIYDGK